MWTVKNLSAEAPDDDVIALVEAALSESDTEFDPAAHQVDGVSVNGDHLRVDIVRRADEEAAPSDAVALAYDLPAQAIVDAIWPDAGLYVVTGASLGDVPDEGRIIRVDLAEA